ncbi:FtsX-like permease family protein [Undibacterium sp. RTI2.1]|uniref:ABC transporter permease n=1 Tax=unclassified Undibacterium TaxID=2630295 RepID=UPI002AB51D40|nr:MULTISPECIES: FtsX-like permease family protein [unclassified Undibacterium]MDY7537260.1 FtsX-like permease family protein [Undibacterium sp. 5I1]MEB0031847.1 FtsX-like permease family protein [Undibacterium sp. RTI2.1]MEB0117557.1 FtsX-like permease family protein [Undibacterium sp. RTI2.2]MEB0230327.1 FtsX-like permease family protein [Undibacterium sp. 10I3]MEB0258163.1 FtsX-like permease family protein [Undibacterium sp. 5I1]
MLSSLHTQLMKWLVFGEWRAHPVRAMAAIAAIALGVALGFAIDLINGAALNEFSAAAKSLTGQSDLQVRGSQSLFDESVYPLLAEHQGVSLANPVLEIDATVPGQRSALKVLGIDVFQAMELAPDLIGVPQIDHPFDTLSDDAIFLSPAAQEWLAVKPGDQLRLQSGTETVSLRVAGGIVRARPGQRIAVMDIATAQWRFGRLGKLSRIDLKLDSGISRDAFRRSLSKEFASESTNEFTNEVTNNRTNKFNKHLLITESADQEARSANMSRAYRVNLNVLALVALFTGAFLIFSTQALSVLRRRSQFALLRVIGMTRSLLLRQILLEGGVLGALGSLIGLAAGYAMAALALRFFGGDLGGGYFPGIRPSVQFDLTSAAVFFLLGTGIALLGSLAPALEAARAQPGPALKSGSEDVAMTRFSSPWPAMICLALGGVLTQLPPVFELPVFGYLAVALLLIGGIGLMPRCSAVVFTSLLNFLQSRAALLRKNQVLLLVLARLANTPNQASIALGGVLSSFSLMVAMAIMVSSFRVSVDDWLAQILSANLYVRTASNGETAAMNPAQQKMISTLAGIKRAEFLRTIPLTLDITRPPVIMIARTTDAADPERTLPLTEDVIDATKIAAETMPVWVSEAMLDLYGYRVGQRVNLPVGTGVHPFTVAGVWRDYARQSGSIQIRLSDYQRLTADLTVTDAALFFNPDISTVSVIKQVRSLPFGNTVEFADPGEIRAISLKIFDRSFAVTYLLEIVAMMIGLFGVAATFSAQTLARTKEFGMLRHVGVTRTQILQILGAEGSLLTGLGIMVGFLLGWIISLVLIFIVNPQSFHWSMQMHIPWLMLASVAVLLLLSSAATAVLSGARAVAGDSVRAVKEDW